MELTSTQAAHHLDLTVWQFRRRAAKFGILPTRQVGNSRLWAPADVERLRTAFRNP